MRRHPYPPYMKGSLRALRTADCDDSVVDMIRQTPTFQSCKSGLYRSRGKMVPKLPITQQEILQDPWTQTISHDKYLLSDGSVDAGSFRDWHVCILNCMQWWNPLFLYISIRPARHSSRRCWRNSRHSVFALLPNRTKALTYRRFLFILKSAVNVHQPVCANSSILDDRLWKCSQECHESELSEHNHRGCFFHFTQCV